MKKIILLTCLVAAISVTRSSAQTNISAKDAAKHINEKVTVCDQVFGGKFLSGPNITLIDVGGSHPNELLTLFIKGDDRKKFKTPPEEAFKGKKVCVTGQVIDYKGKPEIIITDTAQIKLQ
jgi:DNA/RNA endonuclease YhcR with UshA esterase domain